MKTNQFESALLDAEKCIQIDSEWSKGHVRKGDALLSLRRYTPAYNAYNSALRFAPGDSGIIQKLEQAMKGIRGAASFESSGVNSSTSSPSVSRVDTIRNYVRVGVVFMFILYFLPLLGRSYTFYRLFLAFAASDFLISLYSAHGPPQFNMSYAQRILPDPSTMYAFGFVVRSILRN